MPVPCDREGSFRGEITAYGLTESQEKAVGVPFRVHLLEWWDGAAWQDWSGVTDPIEAEGCVWIVKKNGQLNEQGVRSLINFAGWDGNIESIANETWQPTKIGCSIARDDYKGVVRYKVSFVNDPNRTPGELSNCDAGKVQDLSMRFGASLRAIASNAQRNSAPTNGRPAAPPSNDTVGLVGAVPPQRVNPDGIPF